MENGKHNPAGPELRDANPRLIVWSGIGLITLVGMTLALFAWQYWVEIARQPVSTPTPFSGERPLPPQPRLQVRPATELSKFRAGQESSLHSYGWVDKQNGVVHIPIERAIELTLERGLPARAPTPPAEGKKQ